jgi:hypothetical protein
VVREGVYEARARARSNVTTFSKTALSLAVEERRSAGRVAPATVSELTRDLDALSRQLPGRGRAAYKFASPETKAAVDRIVDRLCSEGPIAERMAAYSDSAVELKRHHTADPDELAASRANAEADARARIAPEVLRAGVEIQCLRMAEGVIRTAPLVARAHLLRGADEPARTFYARALMTAGLDEDTAVGIMRKACRCDEPSEATSARVAAAFGEAEPLRPFEWTAWRREMELPELSAGLQQTQATLHLLERTTQQLALPSASAVPTLSRIDWNRLGRATRDGSRGDGRAMTLDPNEGLSS